MKATQVPMSSMLIKYLVWDKDARKEHASTIEAYGAIEAAEKYAEEDVDGSIDGAYSGNGHSLMVQAVEGDHKDHEFEVVVTVDYDPVYSGRFLK